MTKYSHIKIGLLFVAIVSLLSYTIFLFSLAGANLESLDLAYFALQTCLQLIAYRGAVPSDNFLGYIINPQTFFVALAVLLLVRIGWVCARSLIVVARTNSLVHKLAILKQEGKVNYFEKGPASAFTAGLFNPQIYISTQFASSLSSEELSAAILHEEAHAKEYDPLLKLLFETCIKALPPFWGRQKILSLYSIVTEAGADAKVISAQKLEGYLLNSIYKATKIANSPAHVGLKTSVSRIELLGQKARLPLGQFGRILLSLAGTIVVITATLSTATQAAKPSTVSCKAEARGGGFTSLEIPISR